MKTKLLIVLLLSNMSVFADSTCSHDSQNCDRNTKSLKKSYAKEVLSAQEYYDAALKGELLNRENDSDTFYYVEYCENGSYKDSEGNFWHPDCFSDNDCQEDKSERLVNKYLASKLMNLLVGSWSEEVRLLNYPDRCLAVNPLPEHSAEMKEHGRYSSNRYKLELAMDFIGLRIPYFRDSDCYGYSRSHFVIDGLLVKPKRNGLEFSLFYENFDWPLYLHIFQDVKGAKIAVESILNITDDQILYLLGDCFNDLLKQNAKLDNDRYKTLGSSLIKRKRDLEKLYKILLILEKIETQPELYTTEDEKELINNINITLLDYAARGGFLNFTKILLENNGNSQAFGSAIQEGQLNVVKFFIEEKNMNPNIFFDFDPQKYTTPLYLAFINIHFDIAEYLLKKGAIPDDCCYDGRYSYFGSYLRYAITFRQKHLVKLLLEKGADPKALDHYGTTALYVAAQYNDLESAKLLLELGVDVNAQNQDGSRAINRAKSEGHLEMVKFLSEKGAHLNACR